MDTCAHTSAHTCTHACTGAHTHARLHACMQRSAAHTRNKTTSTRKKTGRGLLCQGEKPESLDL
eukprot:171994-Pelagomonas_calceolata.AAC.5